MSLYADIVEQEFEWAQEYNYGKYDALSVTTSVEKNNNIVNNC